MNSGWAYEPKECGAWPEIFLQGNVRPPEIRCLCSGSQFMVTLNTWTWRDARHGWKYLTHGLRRGLHSCAAPRHSQLFERTTIDKGYRGRRRFAVPRRLRAFFADPFFETIVSNSSSLRFSSSTSVLPPSGAGAAAAALPSCPRDPAPGMN